MKSIRGKLLFLQSVLKKHSTLWDVMQDSPERTYDHFDTNVIYRPDRYLVEKIYERRPVEDNEEDNVINLDGLKEENNEYEELTSEYASKLNVFILK